MDSKTEKRIKQLNDIHLKAKEIFIKKNTDYGDAFATFGVVGVLVRIQDKLHRLMNINKKSGVFLVNDETIQDTLLDLHNYCAMALMLMNEDDEDDEDDEDVKNVSNTTS